MPQEYMRVCRTLSSGGALLLQANFTVAKEGDWDPNDQSARNWLILMAEKSGLQHLELVEIHERNLIDKNLIFQRTLADQSGITLRGHYRLTDLGYEICRFIECYDEKENT